VRFDLNVGVQKKNKKPGVSGDHSSIRRTPVGTVCNARIPGKSVPGLDRTGMLNYTCDAILQVSDVGRQEK
jgi:hypothetical protein